MYFIDEKELEAIRRVFERKRLFRYQPGDGGECDLFEREFERYLDAPYSLLVTSGTNALIAALAANGIGPGDEVIIPSYTFVATAAAVTNVGAIPIIANIDETLGISPEDIRSKISPQTKAIIPVHMDGLACDMQAITQLAREHRLTIIEDVAQAIGGSFHGRRLGTWGEFGCFSLNENKNISCGEGGIVTAKTRQDYERLFCMHDASAQYNPAKAALFSATQPFLGASMRISEISGAIMRVQLSRLENILARLRERKAIFRETLSHLSSIRMISGNCTEGDCGSSIHLLLEDPHHALKVGQALRKAGHLFTPLTTRPAHAAWKWLPMLTQENASFTAERNPFCKTEDAHRYTRTELLASVDVLTRVLRLETDIHLSPKATQERAQSIQNILESA